GSASSTDSHVAGSVPESSAQQKSIYERLTWQQQFDEACQRDLALGRRIGFYKFKSELGTGNFSRVSKAAKPRLIDESMYWVDDDFRQDNKI
ncbi:Serine/threonine-protein kinase NIM1, partial [Caligus rogercresseyi]